MHPGEEDECPDVGGLLVTLGEMEVPSILKGQKVPCYVLERVHYYPGTYETPPEYDTRELGTYRNVSSLVCAIATHYVSDTLNNWIESDGMAEMFEEERNLEM